MAPTSAPKNSKDLVSRLKEKKEKDRLLIRQEVENVVLNLKNNSKESANTIKFDIEARVIKSWTRTLAWILVGTLILAGVLFLILWYLSSELMQTKSALEQTSVSLAIENKRLLALEESIQTVSGLSLTTDKTGRIWLQLSPGLMLGQTLRLDNGTEFHQLLGR